MIVNIRKENSLKVRSK